MKLAARLPSPLFIAAAMQEAIHRRDKYMVAARESVGGASRRKNARLARAYNHVALRHKASALAGFQRAITEASGLCYKAASPS